MNSKFISLVPSLIFAVLFIVGIIVTTNSITTGRASANAILQANGGSMSTDKYLVFLQESIKSYRSVGTVLMSVSGAGFVLSAVNALKESKS